MAEEEKEPHLAVMNEENFNDLVHGRPVNLVSNTGEKISLILSDIGIDRMELCLDSVYVSLISEKKEGNKD